MFQRILISLACLLLFLLSCGQRHYKCETSFIIPPFGTADSTVTIAAVGDMMFARSVAAHMDTMGYDAPLRNVASYLFSFDITTGNLECPVSRLGQPMDKKYVFRAKPEIIPELQKSGFDVLCVANNHAFDYGLPCFLNTLARLDSAGIFPVGGGKNLSEALRPVYINCNGMRVGLLAFNDTGTNYIGKNKPACAPAYDKWVFKAIRTARDSCDALIVHIHWGEEDFLYPTDRQITLGRAMIDSGATIILGHHPHCWEGLEFYNNGLIAYSLGNFVFDQKDMANNLTGILELSLTRNGIEDVRITPVELLWHPMEPHIAEEPEACIFKGIIEEGCLGFPTEIETAGVALVLKKME